MSNIGANVGFIEVFGVGDNIKGLHFMECVGWGLSFNCHHYFRAFKTAPPFLVWPGHHHLSPCCRLPSCAEPGFQLSQKAPSLRISISRPQSCVQPSSFLFFSNQNRQLFLGSASEQLLRSCCLILYGEQLYFMFTNHIFKESDGIALHCNSIFLKTVP